MAMRLGQMAERLLDGSLDPREYGPRLVNEMCAGAKSPYVIDQYTERYSSLRTPDGLVLFGTHWGQGCFIRYPLDGALEFCKAPNREMLGAVFAERLHNWHSAKRPHWQYK